LLIFFEAIYRNITINERYENRTISPHACELVRE